MDVVSGKLRFIVLLRAGNYDYIFSAHAMCMLRRKMMDNLMDWKSKPNHKCLVIKGQRQVGKTFIVRRFAETYPNHVELNFLLNPSLKEIFDGDLDTDSIIKRMKLYFEPSSIVPGKTLIFIDEIQECKAARTSLKYFTEDGRYDVVCSGSSLGIDELYGNGGSAPVGYESSITMYGLDFEEFLWGTGVSDEQILEVKRCIQEYRQIPSAYLSVFESRFNDFMIVGGMPEVVQTYIDGKDYLEARNKILELIESAKSDINKYNSGVDRIKTAECYDSIPFQLDQTNKKFMYSRITGEGSRRSAERYMGNLLWIKAAGYGNFCYSLNGLDKPLSRMRDNSSFRVYLSDTGSLSNMYGIGTIRAILNSDYSYNLGAVVENVVSECLKKGGFDQYYYHKSYGNDRMELDFVVETIDGLCAIEVKSGKSRESPSISKLKDGQVSRKIMLRSGNIRDESDGIEGYPLFTAAFFEYTIRGSFLGQKKLASKLKKWSVY